MVLLAGTRVPRSSIRKSGGWPRSTGGRSFSATWKDSLTTRPLPDSNWPVGTVRSRLSRGRDRLRGRLVRRGVTAPAVLGPLAAWLGAQAGTHGPGGRPGTGVPAGGAGQTGGVDRPFRQSVRKRKNSNRCGAFRLISGFNKRGTQNHGNETNCGRRLGTDSRGRHRLRGRHDARSGARSEKVSKGLWYHSVKGPKHEITPVAKRKVLVDVFGGPDSGRGMRKVDPAAPVEKMKVPSSSGNCSMPRGSDSMPSVPIMRKAGSPSIDSWHGESRTHGVERMVSQTKEEVSGRDPAAC